MAATDPELSYREPESRAPRARILRPRGAARFAEAKLRLLGAALCALTLSTSAVVAQTKAPEQGAGRIGAQVAIGAVAAPVAFFGAGWLTKHQLRNHGVSPERAGRAAYVAAWSATWLAASTGPMVAGRDGRDAAALGGSLLGLGAATLTWRLGNALWDDDKRPCRLACWSVGVLTMALPSIGATAAYAASR